MEGYTSSSSLVCIDTQVHSKSISKCTCTASIYSIARFSSKKRTNVPSIVLSIQSLVTTILKQSRWNCATDLHSWWSMHTLIFQASNNYNGRNHRGVKTFVPYCECIYIYKFSIILQFISVIQYHYGSGLKTNSNKLFIHVKLPTSF